MKIKPEYQSWNHMLVRCYNSCSDRYPYYGGRGITVCAEWKYSFYNFLQDMGPRPVGTSLGRINNEGNYEPSNCRWESKTQQANNTRNSRRIEFDGKHLTVTQWSRLTGIPRKTIENRLNRGVPSSKALTFRFMRRMEAAA